MQYFEELYDTTIFFKDVARKELKLTGLVARPILEGGVWKFRKTKDVTFEYSASDIDYCETQVRRRQLQ